MCPGQKIKLNGFFGKKTPQSMICSMVNVLSPQLKRTAMKIQRFCDMFITTHKSRYIRTRVRQRQRVSWFRNLFLNMFLFLVITRTGAPILRNYIHFKHTNERTHT